MGKPGELGKGCRKIGGRGPKNEGGIHFLNQKEGESALYQEDLQLRSDRKAVAGLEKQNKTKTGEKRSIVRIDGSWK